MDIKSLAIINLALIVMLVVSVSNFKTTHRKEHCLSYAGTIQGCASFKKGEK